MRKKRMRTGTVKVAKRMKHVEGGGSKRDRKLKAMKAGLRRTKNPHYHQGRLIRKSTTYYEVRDNRADKQPMKGL